MHFPGDLAPVDAFQPAADLGDTEKVLALLLPRNSRVCWPLQNML
ncbi:hypothetical protein G4228_001874 [Cervus hanglu yarkandensis]|nr:hypothetical protein G4228_001874 [Cervus hanglu yarkandensis]